MGEVDGQARDSPGRERVCMCVEWFVSIASEQVLSMLCVSSRYCRCNEGVQVVLEVQSR